MPPLDDPDASVVPVWGPLVGMPEVDVVVVVADELPVTDDDVPPLVTVAPAEVEVLDDEPVPSSGSASGTDKHPPSASNHAGDLHRPTEPSLHERATSRLVPLCCAVGPDGRS